MTKDVEHDGGAADSSSDSVVGGGDVYVGTDSGLEAPKRPRTATQIAAFEKARAKRAENLLKLSENVEKATKKSLLSRHQPLQKLLFLLRENLEPIKEREGGASSNTKRKKIRFKKRKRCRLPLPHILSLFDLR